MDKQYITNDEGKKVAVILPIKDYKMMIEDLEALDDIRLYDEAKESKQEFIDAETAFREIEQNQ